MVYQDKYSRFTDLLQKKKAVLIIAYENIAILITAIYKVRNSLPNINNVYFVF